MLFYKAGGTSAELARAALRPWDPCKPIHSVRQARGALRAEVFQLASHWFTGRWIMLTVMQSVTQSRCHGGSAHSAHYVDRVAHPLIRR